MRAVVRFAKICFGLFSGRDISYLHLDKLFRIQIDTVQTDFRIEKLSIQPLIFPLEVLGYSGKRQLCKPFQPYQMI